MLTPPWTEQPDARWFKSAFPKGAAVYPHHGQNWLTARALRGADGQGSFTMPDDARGLIEGVFGADADIPPGLDANALVAEGQGFADLTQAQMNTLTLSQGYQRKASIGGRKPRRRLALAKPAAPWRWRAGTGLTAWCRGLKASTAGPTAACAWPNA